MTLSMTHRENMMLYHNSLHFTCILPFFFRPKRKTLQHTMYRNALTLLLLAEAGVVTSQQYNFHLFDEVPYVETGNGQMRFLQSTTNVNTPDLTAATDICSVQAPNFICEDTIRIDADDLSFTDVKLTFGCRLDSGIAFDYRSGQNCACSAEVTHSDSTRPSKTCPCSICPANFGDSPIAIDCTKYDNDTVIDPFIIDKCSSLDCGFGCNGTCSFDCENSGPECEFCSDANSPTASPTGEGLGGGDGKGGSSAFLPARVATVLPILVAGAVWMAL
jgi:hypothetical protein